MKIYSVYDSEFAPYGRIVGGMDACIAEIMPVLAETPLPQAVEYVALEPKLQCLPAARAVSDRLFGGMPVQLGWCNGHNTKLNCLEYHRDSEFSAGTEGYILLVAGRCDIRGGILNTESVKAFRVPAGVMVECYATTLHYTPCQADPETGFRVLIVLPMGTNTEKPSIIPGSDEEALLWARNKWLLAHSESEEAKCGAAVRLTGKNIDISGSLNE